MASNANVSDPLGSGGVIPPTITAFHEDESLDEETTGAHARFVVDRGAHAVFPLGTNGEFPLLTPEECERVVRAVVEEVGDEVAVVAGVGAPSTRETIQNAERATAAGADGLVVVTPYYFPLDDEALYHHYRRVSEAVSLPIYVYHIPPRTGNRLALSTLEAIAALENVVGCKDSSKDVPWLAQAIDANPDLTFLSGSDSLVYTGFAIGCQGIVSGVANVYPELVVDCYAAWDAGEHQRAREHQQTIFAVRDALGVGPAYLSGVKSALERRGFDAGPLRSPLRRKSADDHETMMRRLDALDLV